jgi:hypothetical protein
MEIESLRSNLITQTSTASAELIESCKALAKSKKMSDLLAAARLAGPLLENELYSKDGAEMVRSLLKSPYAEARYAALEALEYALGDTPIADELLQEAQAILRQEKSVMITSCLARLTGIASKLVEVECGG